MNRRASRILAFLSILAALPAAAQPAAAGGRPPHARPKALDTFGTGESYYRVGPSEFSPTDSALTYTDRSVLSSDGIGRYPTV